MLDLKAGDVRVWEVAGHCTAAFLLLRELEHEEGFAPSFRAVTLRAEGNTTASAGKFHVLSKAWLAAQTTAWEDT